MNIVLLLLWLLAVPGHTRSKYNIVDFGAVGNATTMNTRSIQEAIDKASADGGGEVVIPGGRFLTSTLRLKSNVELHLDWGAVLLGSTNPYDYPILDSALLQPVFRYPIKHGALIEAIGVGNISITGSGTINMRGRRLSLKIDSLFYAGKLDSVYYNLRRKRPGLKPSIVSMKSCNHVRVEGVTLKNSSGRVQNYALCHDLLIDGIKVESDAYWNNGGIIIDGCTNAIVTHCFVNASDDGITLKSSYRGAVEDSVTVSDCTVRSSASAVKLGRPSVAGFRNIVIKNIKVYDTFRSAIAIECVDGGVLDNVLVDSITATNTGNPIFIRLSRHRSKNGRIGSLRNITIENIRVTVPFSRPDKAYDLRGPEPPYPHNPFPSSITGIPGHDVRNVTLRNIVISMPGRGNPGEADIPLYRLKDVPEDSTSYPEFSEFGELPAWGLYTRHVDGLRMINVRITARKPDFRPCFVFDHARNVNVDNVVISKANDRPAVILRDTKSVKFMSISVPGLKGSVVRRVGR